MSRSLRFMLPGLVAVLLAAAPVLAVEFTDPGSGEVILVTTLGDFTIPTDHNNSLVLQGYAGEMIELADAILSRRPVEGNIDDAVQAMSAYAADVRSGAFPDHSESYHLAAEQSGEPYPLAFVHAGVSTSTPRRRNAGTTKSRSSSRVSCCTAPATPAMLNSARNQ